MEFGASPHLRPFEPMPNPKQAQLPPSPHWYKDAVIYQLHVKSFFDFNNDGVGDFPGLISRLN